MQFKFGFEGNLGGISPGAVRIRGWGHPGEVSVRVSVGGIRWGYQFDRSSGSGEDSLQCHRRTVRCLGRHSLRSSSRTTFTYGAPCRKHKTLISYHHSRTHFSGHRRTVRSVIGLRSLPRSSRTTLTYRAPYHKQEHQYHINTPGLISAATVARSAPSYGLVFGWCSSGSGLRGIWETSVRVSVGGIS